jgi:uncharacterized protein (PEP-CTERM system associated)
VAAFATCADRAGAEPQLRPSITITEEFSDNIDLTPDNEQSAFVTRVTPGLSFRGDTSRFKGGFDGAISTRYATAGQDSGFQVNGGLTADGDLQLVRDRLSLEAQASISQQVLNNEQVQTEANLDTVQVYQVSPVLRNRIGGFAVSEVRYILGQILANSNDFSDTTAHVGQASLASGSDFDRLRWLLDGRISEAVRSGDSNVSRRDVGLETEYGITRWLSAIASGGYQSFDDGDPEAKFDSPTYRGGFRWRPGRRTDIALTYGKSDDRFSPAATLRYQLTEASHFLVRYFESLSTSQQRLFENVSLIGIDPQIGVFIDERSDTPLIPGPIRSTSMTRPNILRRCARISCSNAAFIPSVCAATSATRSRSATTTISTTAVRGTSTASTPFGRDSSAAGSPLICWAASSAPNSRVDARTTNT